LVFLGLTYPLFRGWVFTSKDAADDSPPATATPQT
jgi:hypothetical protein